MSSAVTRSFLPHQRPTSLNLQFRPKLVIECKTPDKHTLNSFHLHAHHLCKFFPESRIGAIFNDLFFTDLLVRSILTRNAAPDSHVLCPASNLASRKICLTWWHLRNSVHKVAQIPFDIDMWDGSIRTSRQAAYVSVVVDFGEVLPWYERPSEREGSSPDERPRQERLAS